MAQFKTYKYTDDDGDTHRIRLSPASATAQTTAATQGAVDSNVSAQVSEGRRELGLHARVLVLYRELTGGSGASAFTKKLYTRLAILLKSDFDNYTFNQDVAVNGTTWKVQDKLPEKQR